MSSGPVLLFDKSVLQALSVDESVWFDNFFTCLICPLFYVETLADLSKSFKSGRNPESEVRRIASKFPDMGGTPSVGHLELCAANLHGHHIPMRGQIMVPGGHSVEVDGKRGTVIPETPETEIFHRWQKGHFQDIEKGYASRWRKFLSAIDLKEANKLYGKLGFTTKCKDLKEAAQIAKATVNSTYPYDQMKLASLVFGIPRHDQFAIVKSWQERGLKPISQYAPYASFVLSVELFFQIAIESSLISAERNSNRVDIAYLFYLPFCDIFTSSDKLHRSTCTEFLRADQRFVWGPDLKGSLASLNDHYSKLPEDVKRLGVLRFATKPPSDEVNLVSQLWDAILGEGWRLRDELVTEPPNRNEAIANHINQFVDAKPLPFSESVVVDTEVENLTLKRTMRAQKGSWTQVGDIEDN